MKLNAYTILDTASGAYTRPLFFQSDGQASRWFKDEAQNAETPIGKHPEDYSLHRIGSFNDNTAELLPERTECIHTALEALSQTKQIDHTKLQLLDDEIKEQQRG